jgi:hypothetical protein
MNNAISEADTRQALSIAGSLGLDLDDIRTIFPTLDDVADEEVDRCLKHGQVLHRLNVSAKLYGIIESPQTAPKDLRAAERHLRDVHAKGSAQSGSQELLNLLRGTVPLIPPADYEEDEDEEMEEEIKT